MRIAVVAPTYLPSRRANTIQVMKVCQALTSLGHVVRLAVPLPRLIPTNEVFELAWEPGREKGELYWEQIATHYGLHQHFEVEWLQAMSRWRSYDFALRAVLWARRWAAELLYTRHPQTAALASLLGMQTILEVHDLPQRTMARNLLHLYLLGKGARRLVVISRALAQEFNQSFRILSNKADFVLVAPDGVDLQRYTNLPEPQEARQQLHSIKAIHPSFPIERFTAGYSGHLYPGRGVEMLLEMAKALPMISFLIVGGEPAQVATLCTQVSQAGLQNMFVCGFVPNAQLPLYQAACEALLMPYEHRVEASSGGDIAPFLSPMKAFEYLACGRIILSSDLPVLREVLDEQNAILLPPREVDTWVAALRSVAETPQRYAALANQARRDSRQYTWETRMQRILEGITLNSRRKMRVEF